jgi:hypothetical protein
MFVSFVIQFFWLVWLALISFFAVTVGEMLFFSSPVAWRAKPFWVEGGGHNNIETMLR